MQDHDKTEPANGSNKESPIFVNQNQSEQRYPAMWLPHIQLFSLYRYILLSPTAWLNDSIITASQTLIKNMSPIPGFQSVNCGLTMTYDVQLGEFVQIVNNGQGHWLTISTVGVAHLNIFVYDSMYSSTSNYLKSHIAALLATK